jgi:hypothetical protein
MNTTVIKEKLHNYIESGDDRLLKLMFAVAKEYTEDDDTYEFTDEEIKVFEERRKDRLSGKSKTYTWQEAKMKIVDGNGNNR